jgi:hypothetical protein
LAYAVAFIYIAVMRLNHYLFSSVFAGGLNLSTGSILASSYRGFDSVSDGLFATTFRGDALMDQKATHQVASGLSDEPLVACRPARQTGRF